MGAIRIACSVSLHVELYDEIDGPEGRLAREALSLVSALANAQAFQKDPAALNSADPCALENEGPAGARVRPFFVLSNIAPISWSFVFNTFRRADEFECTIPLSLIPIPPEAIRNIVCYAAVRHLSADEWDAADGQPAALIGAGLANADFAGICSGTSLSIQPDSIPTIKLPFKDFLGLLASHKVPAGVTMDRSLPISAAIRKLLVGTPAEGLCVRWVDPGGEPTVGEHIPKAVKQRKAGKKPAKPAKAGQPYLDMIVEECSRMGCVPRVNVNALEVSRAGPLYAGQTTGSKAAIFVSQIVESVEAEHALIGVKTMSVQVVGYDPDTGESLTARWPPDPKSVKPIVVEAGQPPRLPPLAANIGLPGFEQLDDSVLLVPVGPVTGNNQLLAMAQMIFLERTRQRIRYTIKTHAPWSNPLDPDTDGGSLLRLRAGDTVTFAYLTTEGESESGDGSLLPPVVRALTGWLSAEGFGTLLERNGVPKDVAARIGGMLASVPRLSIFRVDELSVSGGAEQDAELTIKLANFLQITDDVQRKAEGRDPAEHVQRLIDDAFILRTVPVDELQRAFADAQKELDDSGLDGPGRGDLQDKLNQAQKSAMKGR